MKQLGKGNSVRVLYHLMCADSLERIRRYSFLITIGLTIFGAYLYLPSKEANYLTLGLGNYRGIYNSAWVGGALAILSAFLLSLPAFYLVKNSIERDEQTRVGQIIATTPIRKLMYILGKALSNFVFLTVLACTITISGMAMQLLLGESKIIDPLAFLSPMIFIVLPVMSVIAALALLFETIPWLRGTLGNVLYFFIWLGILIATASIIPTNTGQISGKTNDFLGVLAIVPQMMKDTAGAFPSYSGSSFTIGSSTLQAPLETFNWGGIHWTIEIILGRLMWVAGALLLSLASAIFFKRFDPAFEKHKSAHKTVPMKLTEDESFKPVASTSPIHLTPLTPIKIKLRLASILIAELRISLKGMPWWWYLAALGLFVAGLYAPVEAARQWLLPLAWLWPLPLWSSMGSREKRYLTSQLVFSAPHPLSSQLPIIWLVGVIVAVITGGGVLINLIMAGALTNALALITGAIFIPSLALASGSLSGGSKLFEVLYMLWWYAGPINQVEALNFMGTGTHTPIELIWIYLIGAISLVIISIFSRCQQIKK